MDEQQASLAEETRKPLAARMKEYEAVSEGHLQPSRPAILRLDGHAFSKFTTLFAKPFDERIHKAMLKTCTDLLEAYPTATLAYTQSDEITLVFPEGVGNFNDRVMKISTLAAGLCSVHFHAHLMDALIETPEPEVKATGSLPLPYFDSRLFNVPTVEECLNNILWRCRGDAIRNSISSFARSFFSTAQMHGKNKEAMLEMLKKEKGVVFEESVPKWALEGSIVKKTLVKVQAVDMKTGEPVTAMRTRMRSEDRGITKFSDENLALVREKYWAEV